MHGKQIFCSFIAITSILSLIMSSFSMISVLLVKGEQSETFTVWVKVYRIQKIDDIENPLEDGADWNYEISVYDGDEFVSQEDTAPSNNDDVIVDRDYQFDNIKTTYTTIYIHLWDSDLGGAATEDADISSRAGYDNYRCAYDLELDDIDTSVSDTFVSDGGYYKTSGDYDGSTDTDENDANLWFKIWDSYTPTQGTPDPEIVSVTFDKAVVDYGDWVTITVKTRNNGEEADEMYISVSLPDNPPSESIQMVSHDLQQAYILPVGAEVWGDYGTTFPIVLEYPLVEGFKEFWEAGEMKTLQFKVKPQNTGTFRFFVKTTAQVNGEWTYDPSSGIKDQQNEYVHIHQIDVQSSEPQKYTIRLSSLTTDELEDVGTIVFPVIEGEHEVYTLPTSIEKPSAWYMVWARLPSEYKNSYTFLRWESSGGITVDQPESSETSIEVSGDGELTAVWKLRVLYISKELPDGATYRPGSAVTVACKVTDDLGNPVSGSSVLAFVTPPSETVPQTIILTDLENGEYAYYWTIPDSAEAGTYTVSFQASTTRYTAYSNDYFIVDTGTGHIASDAWIGNVTEGESVYFDFFIPYQETTMTYYLDVVMRSSDADYLVLNLIDSEGNHISASGTNPQRITLQNQWGSFRIQIYGSSIHTNGVFYVGYMSEYGYNRIFEVSEMEKEAAEYLLEETTKFIVEMIVTEVVATAIGIPPPISTVISLARLSITMTDHAVRLKNANEGRCLTVWSGTTDGKFFVGTVIMDGLIFDLTTEVASKTIRRLKEENYKIYVEAQDFTGYRFDHWEVLWGDPNIELIYSRNTWISLIEATSIVKAVYQPVETAESKLRVTAHSPVNIMVTDPLNSRVGYDPATGKMVNEIYGAAYSGIGTEPQIIVIPDPIQGVYVIDAFGTGAGNYTLEIKSIATNGTVIGTLTLNGTASQGKLDTYSIELKEDYNVVREFPDNTPPNIFILSPENKTYLVNDIPLTFTVSESAPWMGYSLDGQMNVTITGNTTLLGLTDGSHNLIVFSKDATGNTGASETIYFSINTQPEPFPMWIVAAIVIIAAFGTAVYLLQTRKKTKATAKPSSFSKLVRGSSTG